MYTKSAQVFQRGPAQNTDIWKENKTTQDLNRLLFLSQNKVFRIFAIQSTD